MSSEEARKRVSYIDAHEDMLVALFVRSFNASKGDVVEQAKYLIARAPKLKVPLKELEAATLMANQTFRREVVTEFILKHKGAHIDNDDAAGTVESQIRLALQQARKRMR